MGHHIGAFVRSLPFATGCIACLVGDIALAEPELDDVPRSTPIYGGTPVTSCGWPTTVYVDGCTGTLVHPEVVIYASHCGTTAQQIFFGDSIDGPGRSIAIDFCRTHQETQGTDWAFCRLAEPVDDLAIAPPLMGCETEILQPGVEVWMVGFGEIENGDWGAKYQAPAILHSIDGGEAFIGGDGTDTCYGDSGGPAYIQLDDGSWRAFGITSYGPAVDCGPGTYFSMMHTGMQWFESESGVDLTPCHDADGTWNPGPNCGGFALDPATGTGAWPGCGATPTSEASSTCGAAFGGGAMPPVVTITAPHDGASFDGDDDDEAEIDVTVDAMDPDGIGIAQVQLFVDGAAVGDPDTSAPYEFAIDLDVGAHELSATAIDADGDAGESSIVAIEIHHATADGTGDDGRGGTSAADDDGDGSGGSESAGAEGAQHDRDSDSGCGCSHGPTRGLALFVVLAVRRRRQLLADV